MASLDAARAAISQPGFMEGPLAAARVAWVGLEGVRGIEVLRKPPQDPLRITVRVSGLGMTGFRVNRAVKPVVWSHYFHTRFTPPHFHRLRLSSRSSSGWSWNWPRVRCGAGIVWMDFLRL